MVGGRLNLKLEILCRTPLSPVFNCMVIDDLLRSVFKFYIQYFYDIGIFIVPILQKRKTKHIEFE